MTLNDQAEIIRKYLPDYDGPVELITGSGSNRMYMRVDLPGYGSSIAVYGASEKENATFAHLAEGLQRMGFPVPHIYKEFCSSDGRFYVQNDLGRRSLYDVLEAGRKSEGHYSGWEREQIKKAIDLLCDLHEQTQYPASQDSLAWKILPPEKFYPYSFFDEKVIDYDCNYFRFCFLKAVLPQVDEVRLTQGLERLKSVLLERYMGLKPLNMNPVLLYRDFQPRNLMFDHNEKLHLIDFQGAQVGPPFYDLASFLWQASARYPAGLRENMIDYYYERLQNTLLKHVSRDDFKSRLRYFVLFRLMQVLGAYGFRGYFERKDHFLKSIGPAVDNLREWLTELSSLERSRLGYLANVLMAVCQHPQFNHRKKEDKRMNIRVFSFSYKKGLPEDVTGNGGGYVFDCRAVHNPGRYPQYKNKTGRDKEVIDFLEENGEMREFLAPICKLADAHIERYRSRGFNNLMFSFGCTGGQHRSVYAAEFLANHIYKKYNVRVELNHREQHLTQVFRPLTKQQLKEQGDESMKQCSTPDDPNRPAE